MGIAASDNDPIEVLVLGDWVLDENWVLARHRSLYSDDGDRSHFRALGDVSSRVLELCGAGRVARFLYWCDRFGVDPDSGRMQWIESDKRSRPAFSIFGIGVWSQHDEVDLYRMFHPLYPVGLNPFSFRSSSSVKFPDYSLDGLYLGGLKLDPTKTDIKAEGTARAYRLYRTQASAQGGIALDRRVDFELRYSVEEYPLDLSHVANCLKVIKKLPQDQRVLSRIASSIRLRKTLQSVLDYAEWENQQAVGSINSTINSLSEREALACNDGDRTFRYVVVRDLQKGIITSELLSYLKAQRLVSRETCWLVVSRSATPEFLEVIKGDPEYGRLRLLFIPPRVASQMERSPETNNFVPKWFAGELEPTREGLKRIYNIYQHCLVQDQPLMIVAMPKGMSILAVEGTSKADADVYWQPKSVLKEAEEYLVGRAGMFFAVIAAQLIRGDSDRREEILERALGAAHELVKGQLQNLRSAGEDRRGEGVDYLNKVIRMLPHANPALCEPTMPMGVRHERWKNLRAGWEEFPKTGIREMVTGGYVLELWRAMGDLEGYIEVVAARRQRIAHLMHCIRDFLQDSPRRSFSAMIVAPPGSGKSYLVSRIAAALGVPHHNFNVTQLLRREDITSCFDAIASAQAQDHNKRHIVFFDEIRSEVEGLKVYDRFLTVLEDGTYLRGGQLFRLDPCIWLFADTKELCSDKEVTKEEDFKSRLSLEKVILNEDEKPDDSEKIYGLVCQGANQLQLQHADVTRVSAAVLKAFSCLDNSWSSNRAIRHLALKFRGIRYGEVRLDNMPEELAHALKKNGSRVSEYWRTLAGSGDEDQQDRLLDFKMIEVRRQP